MAEIGTDPQVRNCDLNVDKHIDLEDLGFLADRWLNNSFWGADLSGDGFVDLNDFSIFSNHWLTCYGIPSYAGYPDPADATINAGTSIMLKWAAAPDATSHDVYFGTDQAVVTAATTEDPNVYMGNYTLAQWHTDTYDINGLQYEATYFWRVDEITPCGIYKGSTWSFTVMEEPDTDAVGWWRFEEGFGTTTQDSAGSNNGTLIGNTTWTTGKIGSYALQFDGVNDWVEIADDDALDIAGQMTICAWINCNDAGFTPILAKQPGASQISFYPGNYQLWLSSRKIAFSHENGGVDYSGYESSSTITEGIWQHVAVTIMQDGNVNFYKNGLPAGSESQYGTFGIFNDRPVRIGRFGWGNTDYDGTIDDVRIYNRELSSEEIEQIYLESVE